MCDGWIEKISRAIVCLKADLEETPIAIYSCWFMHESPNYC